MKDMPEKLEVGQIYAFRTSPYSEFAPPVTDRYAAFKIIGIDKHNVAIAVRDGIWTSSPTLEQVLPTSILRRQRFKDPIFLMLGERPAVCGVLPKGWHSKDGLEELVLLGTEASSDEERTHASIIEHGEGGASYSTIYYASLDAEGEWRWRHDREAWEAELVLTREQDRAKHLAEQERYRNRLRKLTWEQLMSETPFANWSSSSPVFPPEAFTHAARAVIRDACITLRDLGPKPRRPEVRAILKKTVEWFNEADEEAGGLIETVEREDICAVLEEMAHLARQKVLVTEIDAWRNW
jgi:hypothetical protein